MRLPWQSRGFPFAVTAILPGRTALPIETDLLEVAPARGAEEVAATPNRVESRLRDSDLFLLALAAGAGVMAGLSVTVMNVLIGALKHFTFGIPYGAHLSAASSLPWPRVATMPILGGLIVGILTTAWRRWRAREMVDAIEANALFGGRMSVTDSLALVVQTIFSGGFGASVGLEAAYTQMGSALASRLGRQLGLRRDDMRTLVGCGAAGAIAAAFNAPLCGAFYAFELIVGSYTLQTMAPIGIAALTGVMVVRALWGAEPIFVIWHPVTLALSDYVAFFFLGLASAALAIVVMKGVTGTEALFRGQAVPRWARPVLGGVLLAVLGLPFPQALGSGHGGILHLVHAGYALPFLAGLVFAKVVGSAVSIGSGFRGGMFSSSLFLGGLFGDLIGSLVVWLDPHLAVDPLVYALVGMGTVAAAIVGAPVTMIMLVLETTGDFSVTVGVMIGAVAAHFWVRHWFGYSFATWRFHLRGLKIRSPEDVGWINELMIGPMMRRDPAVIAADQSLEELRRRYPPGSAKEVFVVDGEGRLSGMVDPLEASAPGRDTGAKSVGELVAGSCAFLLPSDNLRTALGRFTETAQEILPVIDNPEARRVIGYLSEAYALRRYAAELEAHRGARQDDAGIFSPLGGEASGGPHPTQTS
jgi:chloride channel protein, CIC family